MVGAASYSWLTRFAVVTAAATVALICRGGLVTSHGAGLAVPDWPTTYGYNMFFFPISLWGSGGIHFEHTHRLVASMVGLFTVALSIWIWLVDKRRWFRMLGVGAVVAVIAQGVLGGLRVTALKDELGMVHAALAQLFLGLICAIALFSSRWWRTRSQERAHDTYRFRGAAVIATAMIFAQLILGAVMRHQHAGLAIPDFPTAYKKIWPELHADAIARYNRDRMETRALNPITAPQIVMQMLHRILAAGVLIAVTLCARKAWRSFPPKSRFRHLAGTWVALILTQIMLGAATIWTNKAADIATAHVAVGALTLSIGCILTLAGFRVLASDRPVAVPANASSAELHPRQVPAV